MLNFFENKIYRLIDNADNSMNLDLLISQSHGMYIKEIYMALLSYIESKQKNKPIAESIINQLLQPFDIANYEIIINRSKYLPIPHILDSDWRFTLESSNILSQIINKYSPEQGNLVMIGTPSLFLMLNSRSDDFHYNTMLIEKNNIKYYQDVGSNIITNDVSKFSLEDYADIIVCDPPWYFETIKMFIQSAQRMLRKNTHLILVVPPEGVREGIRDEYQQIINLAEELGFSFCSMYEEIVTYVSPPFEMKALETMGITSYPIDWRKGSVMVFRKIENKSVAHIVSNLVKKDAWEEATISNVRFKVKLEKTNQEEIIKHIVKNDIYPTVSMRNKLCKNVNVWTSGNRVFACKNTYLFFMVLDQLSKLGLTDKYLSEIVGDDQEKEEYYKLIVEVVKLERKEYARLWD